MHKTYPKVVTRISYKYSHDSTVSTVLATGWTKQGIKVQLSSGTRNFSPLETAKVHPTSLSVGTVSHSPWGKAAGVCG